MISLLVIACNEEYRLAGCIESCRPAVDEVVVVVQESQDRTLEIALRCADVVVPDRCHGISEPSRALGLSHCSGEWVLSLDADEALTHHARDHIGALCEMDLADVYLLPHTTTIGGQVFERTARPRLFRRDWVDCPVEIHSVFAARSGARVTTARGRDWIEHRKSWDEQHLDDARYARVTSVTAT